MGIVLSLGIWIGIASFFGNFMNTNYILAGAVSANPKLGLMLLFLVLTRHIGGYYGLDRYVLPLLGTPSSDRLAVRGITLPFRQDGVSIENFCKL